MAVDSNSLNYLIKLDWTASKGELWRFKAFDPSPNNAVVAGTSHLDALIYAEDLTAAGNGNFPVRGYIFGGTKVISSYNDACNEPEFGVTLSYTSLFSSNKLYGYVDRIEKHDKSCRNEKSTQIKVTLKSG